MLKIKIELWPFGFESQKREIASMDLWNDGTGDVYNGNYKGKAETQNSVYAPAEIRESDVEDYDRIQPVWSLVARMLNNMGYF